MRKNVNDKVKQTKMSDCFQYSELKRVVKVKAGTVLEHEFGPTEYFKHRIQNTAHDQRSKA